MTDNIWQNMMSYFNRDHGWTFHPESLEVRSCAIYDNQTHKIMHYRPCVFGKMKGSGNTTILGVYDSDTKLYKTKEDCDLAYEGFVVAFEDPGAPKKEETEK